jgi:hypothetical protein
MWEALPLALYAAVQYYSSAGQQHGTDTKHAQPSSSRACHGDPALSHRWPSLDRRDDARRRRAEGFSLTVVIPHAAKRRCGNHWKIVKTDGGSGFFGSHSQTTASVCHTLPMGPGSASLALLGRGDGGGCCGYSLCGELVSIH